MRRASKHCAQSNDNSTYTSSVGYLRTAPKAWINHNLAFKHNSKAGVDGNRTSLYKSLVDRVLATPAQSGGAESGVLSADASFDRLASIWNHLSEHSRLQIVRFAEREALPLMQLIGIASMGNVSDNSR